MPDSYFALLLIFRGGTFLILFVIVGPGWREYPLGKTEFKNALCSEDSLTLKSKESKSVSVIEYNIA